MAYTNVLQYAGLGGASLCGVRTARTCVRWWWRAAPVYNSEPLAPFVDIVSLGERGRCHGGDDSALSKGQAGGLVQGTCVASGGRPDSRLYIPLYEISYREDGLIASILPQEGAPERVKKADCYRYGPVLLSGKNHCALHGDHTRPCDAGAFSRVHSRMPFLSGWICLPPGAQPQPSAAGQTRH